MAATQTKISYYNAYDGYPNVAVVISWDREYREPPLRVVPSKKRLPPKKRRPAASRAR